jgi:hypothetical protein
MMNMMRNMLIGTLQMLTLSNSQPLIGSVHDEHGCVTDGGYQWCDSLNECVRPWMTPCPETQPVVDPGFSVPVNPPIAVDPLPPSLNSCMSNPCQNGGQCQSQQIGYTCLCNSGYTGINCDVSSSPPPTISPPPANNPPPPTIPYGCATWFDGCNHCMVTNGQLAACTRMMCFTQRPPECLSYNRLNEGDVCYRFCENGSEQTVNARDKCPSGTQCVAPNTVGFDSCGANAWRCVAQH